MFLEPNPVEVNQTEKIATDWFGAWSWGSPIQTDRADANLGKVPNSQEHSQSTEIDHGNSNSAGVPLMNTNIGQDKVCRENEKSATGVQSYPGLTEVCSGNQQAAGQTRQNHLHDRINLFGNSTEGYAADHSRKMDYGVESKNYAEVSVNGLRAEQVPPSCSAQVLNEEWLSKDPGRQAARGEFEHKSWMNGADQRAAPQKHQDWGTDWHSNLEAQSNSDVDQQVTRDNLQMVILQRYLRRSILKKWIMVWRVRTTLKFQ